ncbi:MAG: DUF1573 domain-containing protein [Candidatus Zixiibacteriota bacterium]
MRPLLLAALLLLVGVFSGFGQPKLEIPSNKFDFGISPQNASLVQFFWFKSIGTDTVRITKLTTGCDCATMPLPQNWLAPGDSMHVGLFWHSERKVGNSGRYPYIFTNASPDPYRIYLTALVISGMDSAHPVSVKPYKVELSKLPTMSLDTTAITFTNHSKDSFALSVISSPIAECEIELPQALGGNRSSNCVVRVKPEYRDQEFERSFTVLFEGPGELRYRYTVPVRRKIYGN